MKTPLHTVLNSLQKINLKDVGLDDDEMKSLFNLAKDKKIVSMMNVHELLNQHSHNHLPLSTNAHTIFLSIYKWLKKQNKGNSLENFIELEGVLKAHDNVASQIIIHDTDSITSEERNKSANNIHYNTKDAFAYHLNGYETQNLISNHHSNQNHSRTNTITTSNSLLDEFIPVPGANGQGGIGLLLPPASQNNAQAMLRLIGIKLVRNQPLGITIREEDNGDFVVARILQGGCVDRQGLLHPGDIIREINGVPVRTMEQINQALRTALFNCNNPNLNQNRNSNDYDNTPCPRETDETMSNYSAAAVTQTDHRSSCSITLKIVPNYAEKIVPAPVYVKALYDYDPRKDNLIPSRDAGLRFRQGDILEIVNKEDPNWWQARRIKSCTYHHVTNMGTGSQSLSTKDTSNNNNKINMSKKNHKTGSINTGMSEDGISMGIDDTNSISTSFGGGISSVARLIPSATLAETRRAYAKPTLDIIGDFPDGLLAHTAVPLPASQRLLACGAVVTRTQARKDYRVGEKNAIFDECDVKAYLEVSRMPPFQRKCLVLIGPRGVGKACLKHMLVAHSNHMAVSWSNGINREENNSTTTTLFGSAIPHTSRPPRQGEIPGQSYHFVTDRGQMEADIAQGDTYLEHGTFNEHLYGTRFDSIHAVINDQKKMCIITCSEGAVAQALCNPVYTPYVVFIAAPPIDKFRGLWRTISTHTYPFRTNTRSRGNGKDENCDTSSDSDSDSDRESEDTLSSEETSGDDLKNGKKKKIKQIKQNQNGKNDSPSTSNGENSGGSYDLNAEKSLKNGHPPAKIPLSSRLNSMALSSANSNLSKNNHHIVSKKEHKTTQNKTSKKLPPALLLSPLRNPGDIDSHEIFEESCQLKRQYSHLFDLSIVNTNIMDTYALIIEHVEKLRTETQWVPTDWIF